MDDDWLAAQPRDNVFGRNQAALTEPMENDLALRDSFAHAALTKNLKALLKGEHGRCDGRTTTHCGALRVLLISIFWSAVARVD
jgi:hypothetical protein